jgi:Transposase DDE domain
MKDSAEERDRAQELRQRLGEMVCPLLRELDVRLDKRLVATFFATLQALVTHRHSRCGLLLSELGGYILSPSQAPAGTKRLSNLLRSRRWEATVVERFLWRRAEQRVQELNQAREQALALWDESVLEKPESLALEGLCPVRSSRAARLKRVKPGFYTPPSGAPIFVPGMQWLSVVVAGFQGVPVLAKLHWWTSRGSLASDRAQELQQVLRQCAQTWGQQVVHVFDRGFANGKWLGQLLDQQLVFVLRWKTQYHLLDAQGKRPAWHMTRGKRSLGHRLIYDARRRCQRKTGMIFVPVTHPDLPGLPLTLVVSRPGRGRKPWYLLTNLPIRSPDDAWSVIFIYARRWQIEMTYRFAKTELAMESPRLWSWHNRLKLLAMVALVVAFLLSLLAPAQAAVRAWLLRHFCHRTGKRHRVASLPLYRVRLALSRLWLSYPDPIPLPLQLTPG